MGTPRQFVTGGSAKPDNGNAGDGAYNQWRLTTTVPNQSYYLNAYANTGHNIYQLDYTETIMYRRWFWRSNSTCTMQTPT